MNTVVDAAFNLMMLMADGAGALAFGAFGSNPPTLAKTSPVDVVTEIDHVAENLIVSAIRERFPGHEIFAEESGINPGTTRWTWLIDALDGTHNFAIGLPLYGLSMLLLYDCKPKLALVQDSHLSRQLIVTADGIRQTSGNFHVKEPSASGLVTVALQQGYAVRRSDVALSSIRNQMENAFCRVLYTWSPAIDMLLLASGVLGGVVGYQCSGPEHEAAKFVGQQIGCIIHTVSAVHCASSPYIYILAWPEVADRLMPIVIGNATTA